VAPKANHPPANALFLIQRCQQPPKEIRMRLGFALPQAGPLAGPESIRAVAERAEALGYDSLWVFDRLLYPLAPKTPYPATRDGRLPDGVRRVLDGVGTLTFAAACTSRIKLGSSVLNAPFYNPVLLGRQLTTLDILSGGRLRVGLGMGWSADEYEAVGVPMNERAGRMNEFLDVVRRLWSPGPSEYQGKHYSLPRSETLKPVQAHIPIYLAAYTPAALQRCAERGDGWNPAGLPLEAMKAMYAGIRAMAQAAGRDPSALELIVRANLRLTTQPHGQGRPPFCGTPEQIREDIQATRALGAHEVLFDGQFAAPTTNLASYLERLELIKELAG
jgi:probable F420-dependent oxidoreductase